MPKMSDGFSYQASGTEIRAATGLDRLDFDEFRVCCLII